MHKDRKHVSNNILNWLKNVYIQWLLWIARSYIEIIKDIVHILLQQRLGKRDVCLMDK